MFHFNSVDSSFPSREHSLKNLSMSNLITWPNGKENGDTLIFARDHTVSR